MNLLRLPYRFLKFYWQRPTPYLPAVPCGWPKSQQGWIGIQVPTGTAVNAQAPMGDGTRGTLNLWADWYEGLGASTNFLSIGILLTGDPVPPTYATNPTNVRAGRMSFSVANGSTGISVANVMLGTLNTALGMLGIDGKFYHQRGLILAQESPMPDDGNVIIVSPAPWRMTELSSADGAWSAGGVASHESLYRPFFIAGCRPCPQVISDRATIGLGEVHEIIG